jgi:hypothetical protein
MHFLLLAIQILLMNWYIAKIVFNITAENTQTPQFDEQLRLISAQGKDEAFLKARIIGIKEEDSFLNDRQERVKWEFINVADIIPVGKLEDGAELYSSIYETNEPKSYIHCVHQKAIYHRMSAMPLQ